MNETKYVGRKFDNPNSTTLQKRRLCITSEPVKFVQPPTRVKKTENSSCNEQLPNYENHIVLNNTKKMYSKFCNLVGDSNNYKSNYNPDIYIDDRDEECITTVRRTCSKIKWTKPLKKSKFHKKCAEKENHIKPKVKSKLKRTTLVGDSDIDEVLISEINERQKFYNECYCASSDHVQSKEAVKPLIISDDRKEQYGLNTIKNARKLRGYDPDSEFLKRLRKYVDECTNYDCQCRDCILEKLEKSLKYTNRRALIEKAYSDVPKPEPYKPKRHNAKINTVLTCKLMKKPQHQECGCNTDKFCSSNKACSCHSSKYHQVNHITDNANKFDKCCSCKFSQCREFDYKTIKPHVSEKSCTCNISKYHEYNQNNTDKVDITQHFNSNTIPQYKTTRFNSEMPFKNNKAYMYKYQNYKDISHKTDKICQCGNADSCRSRKNKQVRTKSFKKNRRTNKYIDSENNTESYTEKPENVKYKGTGTNFMCRAGSTSTIRDKNTDSENNTKTYIENPNKRMYKNTGNSCMCRVHSASLVRDKNFFETHSVSELKKKFPPHQCVHKYKLDERLLPKPINTDSWGQSRCEICVKPYDSTNTKYVDKYDKEFQMPSKLNLSDKAVSPINLPKQIKSSERDMQKVPSYKCSSGTTTSDCRSKLKSIQFDLNMSPMKLNPYKSSNNSKTTLTGPKLSSACHKISFGDNKTILDLDRDSALQESLYLCSSQFFDKYKKNKVRGNVQPNNTLALRYQKGVL